MKVLKKYIFFLFFAHPSFFYSQYSDTLLPFGSRYGMAKSLSLAQDTNVLFTWKQDFFPAYFAPEFIRDSIHIPHTQIKLTSGSKKEQLISLSHTQTISHRWDLNFQYVRASHPGFYLQEKSVHNALSLSNRIRLFRNKLQINLYYHAQKSSIAQNGGLMNDSLVLLNPIIVKENLPTQLSDAQFVNNQKKLGTGLKYYLNKSQDTLQKELSGFYIGYQYRWHQKKYLYQDQRPSFSFYGISDTGIIQKSPSIFDSTALRHMSHQGYLGYQNTALNIQVGMSQENERLDFYRNELSNLVGLGDFKTSYLNIHANLAWTNKNWSVYHQSAFLLGGFLDKNKIHQTKLTYSGSLFSIQLAQNYSIQNPDFQFFQYRSSLSNYVRGLTPIKNLQHQLKIQYFKYFFTQITTQNIQNFTYYTGLDQVQQYDSSLFQYAIQQGIHYQYKATGVRLSGAYQVSEDPVLVPLPLFLAQGNLYFKDSLFKRTLFAEFGLNAFYFSSYYAPVYSPYYQQFMPQSTQKIGNYPVLGGYMQFWVRSFSLRLAMEHINQGFTKGDYRSAPGYFMQDRNFRVSLLWDMYN